MCVTVAMKRTSFRRYPGVVIEGLQQLDRARSIACHSQWAFMVLLTYRKDPPSSDGATCSELLTFLLLSSLLPTHTHTAGSECFM